MENHRLPASRRWVQAALLFAAVAGAGSLGYGVCVPGPATAPRLPQAPPPRPTLSPDHGGEGRVLTLPSPPAAGGEGRVRGGPGEATAEEVHRLCGACHAYPPPDTFP